MYGETFNDHIPAMAVFLGVSLLLIIITNLTYGRSAVIPGQSGNKDECILEQSGVYVSISSEAEFLPDKSVLRWMEVHWWGITVQDGDYVGLWDKNPSLNDAYLDSALVTTTDGGAQLSIRWDGTLFPKTIPLTSQCLTYWAGYVQNGSIIYSSCLTAYPRWMQENKDLLNNMGIADVALPGVHDAGAYGSPDLLIRGDDEIGRWTFTQDETLWQNMVLGVRYFDMRISYYENTEEQFFVNHGDVRIRPLVDYLSQTSSFLRATAEIIIFDIHLFEHGLGDNPTAQIELQDLIESYLGDLMAPKYYGSNARLEQFWITDKRVIVTFPTTTERNLYWSRVNHLWGNVNDLDDLYDYFSTNIPLQTGNGTLWSSMTELTPSTLDVTLNHWGGLRGAANITNEPVNLWLRREWWTMVNVIAMDYMASSGVIETVIETNLIRYICS